MESLTPSGESVRCPRCGAENDAADGKLRSGDRLLIDRAAFSLRTPKRWEVVALRTSETDNSLCVKRIIGLPGERVAIANGEVLIDGRRQRKPHDVQLAMAIAEADDGDLARWHSVREGAWTLTDRQWQHKAGVSGRIDWLEYQHREPTTAGGGAGSPILDGSPVNPAESRKLNPVSDVVLSCTLHGGIADKAFFTIHARGDEFRLILPVGGGGARLSHNGTRVKGGRVESGKHAKLGVEVVVADGQFSIRADGKSVLDYEFEPLPERGDSGPRLAIGADAAALAVSDLEVRRDVHYTPGPQGQTRYRLGPDEYFVLGDNSANSIDSRTWSRDSAENKCGGVTSDMLLGPVLTW
jgi:signal peptidase I